MKRNVIGLTLLLALISTGCEDDSNKDLNINYSLPKLLEEIIFETIDGVEKERKRTYHWDGNTRTRYYRDSSGYGNETSDVQQINIYDEYGYLISSKYYHSSGELWYDFIWIRDRWKILTSKRYLYQDLNRDWKYEWSDLEVKRYDRLNNNNLMLTSKYDDKSRVLSINWVDGRENLYEYDLSYRFRVKEEILDKEPLYSYNWSENICEKFNHKQNKITNIFEVNEFDDIIKDFDENYNLLGTKEYLTERFTDPFAEN